MSITPVMKSKVKRNSKDTEVAVEPELFEDSEEKTQGSQEEERLRKANT